MLKASNYNFGLSLVELMIVLAIVGTLAIVAYPAYNERAIEGRRAEAHSHLFRLQTELEQAYSRDGIYPSSLLSGEPANSSYTYALTVPAGGQSYRLMATVKATGPQANDAKCATIGVTSNGQRLAMDSDGNNSATSCW